MKNKRLSSLLAFLMIFVILMTGCSTTYDQDTPTGTPVQEEITGTAGVSPDDKVVSEPDETEKTPEANASSVNLSNIPAYSNKPYVEINNNIPYFTKSDMTTAAFEEYSSLDSLGRCGVAYANICKEIMPTEERGNIGSVKPSGWHSIRYENVDGKYLYNRCHLIGFQLAGENANTRNLITGTRYLNINGMLPFENMVDDYVEETNNHVLYRVTPIFEGDNLLASGVLMEGWSVEDDGDGICFNVFCYNVQPGIKIDYTDGSSEAEDGSAPYGSSAAVSSNKNNNTTQSGASAEKNAYIANKNTGKLHYEWCSSVGQMNESNKVPLNCTREQALSQGYDPCKRCNP